MQFGKEKVQQQGKPTAWECVQGQEDNCFTEVFVHEGYGMIEPVYVPEHNFYRRALCPCGKAALLRYKQMVAAREELSVASRGKREAFAWLGFDEDDVSELANKTFANFDVARQPHAYRSVQNWLASPAGTLILHGSYGTGKTHLLAALVNELRARGESCLFATSTELFDAIQECIARHEPYRPLLHRAIKASLLVIDDIDKAKHTDFRQEVYFSLIDGRINRDLPTAISTNKLAELPLYVGGAVASRFTYRQTAIAMIGDDYRSEL